MSGTADGRHNASATTPAQRALARGRRVAARWAAEETRTPSAVAILIALYRKQWRGAEDETTRQFMLGVLRGLQEQRAILAAQVETPEEHEA